MYFTEIVLVCVRFMCQNFSFYFVLVFWITIILVLVLWKRRPIILVLVLIFVTKITLVESVEAVRWQIRTDWRKERFSRRRDIVAEHDFVLDPTFVSTIVEQSHRRCSHNPIWIGLSVTVEGASWSAQHDVRATARIRLRASVHLCTTQAVILNNSINQQCMISD